MTERIARWWPSAPPTLTTIVSIAMLALAALFGWSLAYALAYEQRSREWLGLGALVAVALVPVVVRWPVISTFGIYAFIATALDAFPILPGGAALSRPAGALAAAVLLGAGLIERRLGRPPAAALWWAALLLWGILSAMWAIDSDAVFEKLPTKVSVVALYLVAVCFRPSRRDFYWVCALTVLGGLLAAALAYFFGFDQLAETQRAARGRIVLNDMQGNANQLGRVLILPLTLAIVGFIGGRGIIQRALALGCAACIGLGTFISMSRTALAATAAVLLVLCYRIRARWQIVAVMVLLLVVSMFMPDTFYQRIDALISGQDDTGSGRLDIWRTGLRIFVERSGFLGAGLDHFPLLHSYYEPGLGEVSAHNIYLMVLIDLGVPGLAMMLAAIVSGLFAVRRARSSGHGSIPLAALEAACIGTLITGLFLESLFTKSFWMPWILLNWAMYSEKRPDDTSDAFIPRG
jgi:exopolysaccharide production protein ExoQ